MTAALSLLAGAFLALTAQSVLFRYGAGFSRVMRAARRGHLAALRYAAVAAAFTLVSAGLGILFAFVASNVPGLSAWRPLMLTLGAAACYLLAAGLGKTVFPRAYRRVRDIFAPAALNTVALSVPYAQQLLRMDVWETLGYALGSGAAFFLAVSIFAAFWPQFQNPRAPAAFRGLPLVLLFTGLCLLAFSCF